MNSILQARPKDALMDYLVRCNIAGIANTGYLESIAVDTIKYINSGFKYFMVSTAIDSK